MAFVILAPGEVCPTCKLATYIVEEPATSIMGTNYLHCENCQTNFALTGFTVADSSPSTVVGTAGAIIKPAAGTLCSVIVTAAGSAVTYIYDSATGSTGTVIGAIPVGTTVGTVLTFNTQADKGISCPAQANTASFTAIWS